MQGSDHAVTRAACKRRRPEVLPSSKRKRVVLAELPHLHNAPLKPAREKKPAKRRPAQSSPASAEPSDRDDDPHLLAPYASDIHGYLLSLEARRRPLSNYIEAVQRDVTPSMRGILVDWLVEVAEEYKLVSDTLYLAVSYIDRFLSGFLIDRKRLQLLGVACMLIASKYEEISPPRVEDFCYITDNTYTQEEVVKMESEVLKLLNFELGSPTPKTFLRRYMSAAQEDSNNPDMELECLGSYLTELSLLDYGCVRFLPSMVAASVVFLARFTINPEEHPWTLDLQNSTGYKPLDLKDCVQSIHEMQLKKKSPNLRAVREKYKHTMFRCVADLPLHEEIPSSFFEDIVT